MFWTSIGFLSLVVVAAILFPMMRRAGRAVSQVPHAIRIYREQLAELDADVSSGLLTEDQAGAARLEVERRILAASGTGEATPSAFGAMGQRLVVAVIALALPGGALYIYLSLGQPTLTDLPLAMRTQELKVAKQMEQIGEFVGFLETRVEKRPDDAEAWSKLGRLYSLRGRYADSAKAYGRVHTLKPQELDAAADHGEAMVYLSGGTVSEQARKMFEQVLVSNPKHIKARFYLASALAQRPDGLPRAIEIWSGLESDSPPDAPWLDVLRRNLRLAEIELASLEKAAPEKAPQSSISGTGAGTGTGTKE